MDKTEHPEYLELNPVYNGLKKDIMIQNQIQLEKDFFGDIQMTRKKVPVKLYLRTRNKDMTNIKNYHLNGLIDTSFH